MNKKWLILGIIIALVAGIILADRFFLKKRVSTVPTRMAPVTMKTYHDPEQYFAIQVPSNWTINERTAINTTGLNTGHPVKQDVKITQFFVPATVGITVQVYKGQPICPFTKPLNSILAGLPAAYDATIHQWTIPTTNATMVVSIAYPENGGFQRSIMQTQPTAVPQIEMQENIKMAKAVLATFKPNDLKPYQCK